MLRRYDVYVCVCLPHAQHIVRDRKAVRSEYKALRSKLVELLKEYREAIAAPDPDPGTIGRTRGTLQAMNAELASLQAEYDSLKVSCDGGCGAAV